MPASQVAHRCRALHVLLLTAALAACGDDETPSPDPIPIVGSPTAVALARPSAVPEDGTLTLDGTASSDTAGEALRYLWEQTMGPAVSIADPSAANTSATVPEVNENRAVALRLTVTNASGIESSDLVFATIIDGGIAPVADAGLDQAVSARDPVTLDGSASSDPDGAIQNFLWERVSGPVVSLTGPATATPTFDAPDVTAPGTILFRLTVTDSDGISANDTVVVSVAPVPTQLAFTDPPETPLRNTPLTPLAVEVRNQAGERITEGADVEITLSVSNGAQSLEGATTLQLEGGRVELEQTRYPAAEAGVELTASATGLTAATQSIDVSWPSAFPRLVADALEPADAVTLDNADETPSPQSDVVLAFTASGNTIDLDLSGGTPETISTDAEDLVIARYRSDGSLVWFRHFDSAAPQRAVGLELTRDGDLIVLFNFEGTVDSAREPPARELSNEGVQNVGVMRIDSATGDVEWAARFGGAAEAAATDLVLAGNDDPFIVGWYNGVFDPDPSTNDDARTSDGIDAFALRLLGSQLESDGDAPLSFARTPTQDGDERLYAVALSDDDDVNAAGSVSDDGAAWIYRTDRLGTELTSYTFLGTGARNAAFDIEARGQSVQVVGVVSGDSSFGGDTVIPGAGGTDGFFAVFSSADDTLAFVRRVAGSGDDAVLSLARTGAFDASFVLGGVVDGSAALDFGLSQDTFDVDGGGLGTFLLALGFDGRIKWQTELAPNVGLGSFSFWAQPDDSIWLFGRLDGAGTVDLDPFAPTVSVAGTAGERMSIRFAPATPLLIP